MPILRCACGTDIPVEFWHAGVDKSCPRCSAIVSVPSLDVLKRLSGDRHPGLSDWQKLLYTVEHREEPFHGMCHECQNAPATVEVPIELSIMDERVVGDESPVMLTPFGIRLQAPESTERWKLATFPLLFCDRCFEQFRSSFGFRVVIRWVVRYAVWIR